MSYNNNYMNTCIILIFITTVFLLLNNIPIAFSIDEDTELDYRCLPSKTGMNSIYKANLETVVKRLINNTPTPPSGGYSVQIKSGPDNGWNTAMPCVVVISQPTTARSVLRMPQTHSSILTVPVINPQ
ncbi:hypothetical protein CASFOL_040882 [Castilleja foliolosa]|uniref:Uncharacterized protein n=1 Tax=Castilleja foliolosa TaxID=1961234 RepID=A0ABD3BDQ4_9LAMI